MRVGIDFDNTIVNYDGVFHSVAITEGLIPPHIGNKKSDVQAYLHAKGKHDEFTWLQGLVYGKRIGLASVYDGFRDFLSFCHSNHVKVFVVSHKSKYPIIGKKYNLHTCALRFLQDNNLFDDGMLNEQNVFLEETLNGKIEKACDLNLDFFVDDLVKIVENDRLSSNTNTILFDPDKKHGRSIASSVASSWPMTLRLIFNE